MSRIKIKILSLIIAFAMILPGTASFAASSEYTGDHVSDDLITSASNYEEYIDGTAPADDPDPVFGTRRLKVKANSDAITDWIDDSGINALDGVTQGVSYDGSTLLSFDTVEDTEAAYQTLCTEFGEENVIIDLPILTAESSAYGWGTDFMNLDDEMQRQLGKNIGNSGNNAEKIKVAVIDSGIDSSHEIFAGKTISAASRCFIESDDGITDKEGHGTTVAGIIAESTTDNVELMILKTYDDGMNISIETVNQAIRYAADNGADVINLSMASSLASSLMSGYDTQVRSAISDMEEALAYAEDKGTIICASSGNSGGDMDSLNAYPANSTHSIAVGAIDRNGARADFSNYGAKLDFCAPGMDVIVAAFNTGNSYYTYINNPLFCAGTSLAAPYIAACCAFVKMDDRTADNQAARTALKAKCIDYGTAGWDQYFGWGMPKFEDYTAEQTTVDEDAKAAAEKAAREKAAIAARAQAEKAALERYNALAAKYAPGKVKLTKARKGKKSVALTWKTIKKGVNGYQVEILDRQTSKTVLTKNIKQTKKLKKKKTIKKVIKSKKLKKGRYTVRVRAYRIAEGQTFYGEWSKAKSVKLK